MLWLFVGKNRTCRTTEKSGACNSSDFDGVSISVSSDHIRYNKNIFIFGFELIKFTTDDKITELKLLMSSNMIPTALTIGKNTCVIYDYYKFFENEKIGGGVSINSTKETVDAFD